jgi:ubiquinone/menaquinone biosynthesis C-methylase UbiE
VSARDWKRRDALHHDREAGRYDRLIVREFGPYLRQYTVHPWSRRLAAEGARVVLDVGAGTGAAALAVAAAGPGVIAVDMSRGMLSRARHKARAAGVRGLLPVVADAENLPLAAGAVDAVVMHGVLHHLPDVDRAIGEADRVLAAGGWLLVSEPSAEGSWLARAVQGIASFLRPLAAPLAGVRSPAASDERPLPVDAVLDPLRERGYRPSARFLVHLPFLYRVLPPAASDRLAAGLNRGPRGAARPADLLVVEARKAGRSHT